jgi:hypothetical protein
LGAVRSDPARVLREYVIERLLARLPAAGGRLLVVRGSGSQPGPSAPRVGPYDGAWIETDSLAPSEASALARDLAGLLRPGAQIVCLVQGQAPLPQWLRMVLRNGGDLAAWRERRRAAAAWRHALHPVIEWKRRRALGVFAPQDPGWPEDHPLAFGLLAVAEHLLGARAPFRDLGAWCLLEGVRR